MPTYRNVSGGWLTWQLPGERANYGCQAGELLTLTPEQVPAVIGPQVPESAVELLSEVQDHPAEAPAAPAPVVVAPVSAPEPEPTPAPEPTPETEAPAAPVETPAEHA